MVLVSLPQGFDNNIVWFIYWPVNLYAVHQGKKMVLSC
jgi:hypothetical protein